MLIESRKPPKQAAKEETLIQPPPLEPVPPQAC